LLPGQQVRSDKRGVTPQDERPILGAMKEVVAEPDTHESTGNSVSLGRPAREMIYTVSDVGVATCLDGRTGATLWTRRIAGNHSASPVCANGRVYFFSEEGKTVVYRSGRTPERVAENHV
jgi:hypothetical protein